MINNIKLDKIIDIAILQNIQDLFAKATHVAAVTVDYEGKPITKPSNFTNFCSALREDENFRDKCYKCDAYGGIQALINRKPYIYKCHAGLFDFSVPIVIENSYVGAILCGQINICDEKENDEKIGSYGKMSNWESLNLQEEYSKVETRTYKDVEHAAYLIYQISKYMVEHEFVSLMKKELLDKTTELMEEENKRISLEKALKDAELKAIQYQVNPYFLFNALNTIQNLAYLEDAPKTQEAVYNFSDLLKYSIKPDVPNTVCLHDEINYVKNYMAIQKARFGNKLEYSIEIDEKYYYLNCPFMLLHPIIENFIKYVVERKATTSKMTIKGEKVDKNFIINIYDNGDGMKKEKIVDILNGKEHREKDICTSLYNINERLIGLYGKEYDLVISNSNTREKGLNIKITIPMIEGEADV